jgi:hypothetical protein
MKLSLWTELAPPSQGSHGLILGDAALKPVSGERGGRAPPVDSFVALRDPFKTPIPGGQRLCRVGDIF